MAADDRHHERLSLEAADAASDPYISGTFSLLGGDGTPAFRPGSAPMSPRLLPQLTAMPQAFSLYAETPPAVATVAGTGLREPLLAADRAGQRVGFAAHSPATPGATPSGAARAEAGCQGGSCGGRAAEGGAKSGGPEAGKRTAAGGGGGSAAKPAAPAPAPPGGGEAVVRALLYGVINSVVCAPVMIGFAAIIFRNAAFHRDPAVYPRLVKLVLFSSAVHQAIFVSISSLPFAVGQVQDAGLIFLSSMADQVVDTLHADGASDAEVYATTLVSLSLSTFSLGIALIATGRLRLAGLVQYLPLPVVGGYLAYIGLYCLEAGLSLMSSVEVTGLLGPDAPAQWAALASPSAFLPCIPGIGGGVLIILTLQRVHHYLVLPTMLLAIPLLFYALAFSMGYSLDDLRQAGLVAEREPSDPNPLSAWSLFQLHLVHWHVLPTLLPTWLAMYTVVAFSSSLDVAAIQMDMGKQLDFNHELITVGLANAASGLSGGFTGSYIFSTTVFTYRTGTRSRLCGVVVMLLELLLFALPVSIVAFVPKLFFGAVLTFISLDLLLDWLWAARSKVHVAEYAIILLTFLLINLFGLEMGMACGVLVSMAHFIADYARAPVVQRINVRSTVLRSFAHSRALALMQPRLISLRCRGYIFFGSTLQIMEDVLSSIVVPPHLESVLAPPSARPPRRATSVPAATPTGIPASCGAPAAGGPRPHVTLRSPPGTAASALNKKTAGLNKKTAGVPAGAAPPAAAPHAAFVARVLSRAVPEGVWQHTGRGHRGSARSRSVSPRPPGARDTAGGEAAFGSPRLGIHPTPKPRGQDRIPRGGSGVGGQDRIPRGGSGVGSGDSTPRGSGCCCYGGGQGGPARRTPAAGTGTEYHGAGVGSESPGGCGCGSCGGEEKSGGEENSGAEEGSGGSWSSDDDAAESPPAMPTKFVLFDLTNVTGLDATAARACFLNLARTLAPVGIELVFGGVPEGGKIDRLLRGHGILDDDPGKVSARGFSTLDEALEYCEEELLREAVDHVAAARHFDPTSSSNLALLLTHGGEAPLTPPGQPGASGTRPRGVLDGVVGQAGMGLEGAFPGGGCGWPLAALAGGLGGGLGDGLRGAGIPRGRTLPLSAEDGVRHVLAPLVDSYQASLLGSMAPYFDTQNFSRGELIFCAGAEASAIYFIVHGEVILSEDRPDPSAVGRGPYTAGGGGRDPPHRSGPRARLPSAPAAIGGSGGPFTPPPPGPSAPHPSAPGPSGRSAPHPSAPGPSGGSRSRVRLVRYANGGIFGELDFFLHNQRSFDAEAASEETSVLRLRRERLRAMQAEAPQLAAALEHALLKYLCFQVNNKLGLSDGVADASND